MYRYVHAHAGNSVEAAAKLKDAEDLAVREIHHRQPVELVHGDRPLVRQTGARHDFGCGDVLPQPADHHGAKVRAKGACVRACVRAF